MKRSLSAITAILAGMLLAPVALAGDDMTSLSYISYLERYATIRTAHGDETLDVVVNMPVLAGDRLDTSRGARVEVQLADGSTLWLDEFATVDFDAIALSRDDTSSRTALFLAEGTAAIEIPSTAAGDGSLRVDSPAGAVFLNRPGLYRLELRGNEIRVQAHSGFAELPAGIGSEILRGGEEAVVGTQSELQRAAISDTSDDFWTWVQERRHVSTGPTAQYVDARSASHAAVLDSYGDWVYVPTYSNWMWQPHVNIGWVPYSHGRWYWTPVGWSWISYEPWGWYPFHYGSWYFDASFGWLWGWDSVWGPAWVDWFSTPGYVGWCPRGYYDWWYYHNGNHAWGGRWGRPPRWSEVSFNFSGRVRLGQIDPRPWTVVPSAHFSSSHIDRVRLDATRFLRDGQPDREGIVRSGPLVTPFPGRAPSDSTVDSFFRPGPTTGTLPDLSSIMRRETPTGVRSATALPDLRARLTTEVAAGSRAVSDRTQRTAQGGLEAGRWSGRAVPGRPLTTDSPRQPGSPSSIQPGGTASGVSTSPVTRREVVRRDVTSRPAPPNVQSPPAQGTGSHSGSGPTVERHVSPPSQRPPTQSVSWSRQRDSSGSAREIASYRDRWSSPVTRRDVGRATVSGQYASGYPSQLRSVASSRPTGADRGTIAHVSSATVRSVPTNASPRAVSVSHSTSRSSASSGHGHRP